MYMLTQEVRDGIVLHSAIVSLVTPTPKKRKNAYNGIQTNLWLAQYITTSKNELCLLLKNRKSSVSSCLIV